MQWWDVLVAKAFIPLCELSHFVRPQCIDSGYLVNATPHTILYCFFFKLCTCSLHGLKKCVWFGYNPCINFCHFFHIVNFVIFWPQILWKCIDNGYSLYNFKLTFMQLCTSFYGEKMCRVDKDIVWRCACGLDLILQLIFVTFPLC